MSASVLVRCLDFRFASIEKTELSSYQQVNLRRSESHDVSGRLRHDRIASIVVHDSSGRDVETTLPFLVSNKLLRSGLFDFSAEAGYPRLYYDVRHERLDQADAILRKWPGYGRHYARICSHLRMFRERTMRLVPRGARVSGTIEFNKYECRSTDVQDLNVIPVTLTVLISNGSNFPPL